MRSLEDKARFSICSGICFICQPHPKSKYLWHANYPGFACSNLYVPSCSLTPYNTTQMPFSCITFGMKPRLILQWNRWDKSSNSLNLTIIRLLCCEPLSYKEHRLFRSISHTWQQVLTEKLALPQAPSTPIPS